MKKEPYLKILVPWILNVWIADGTYKTSVGVWRVRLKYYELTGLYFRSKPFYRRTLPLFRAIFQEIAAKCRKRFLKSTADVKFLINAYCAVWKTFRITPGPFDREFHPRTKCITPAVPAAHLGRAEWVSECSVYERELTVFVISKLPSRSSNRYDNQPGNA